MVKCKSMSYHFFGGREILKYLGERDHRDLWAYNFSTDGSGKKSERGNSTVVKYQHLKNLG